MTQKFCKDCKHSKKIGTYYNNMMCKATSIDRNTITGDARYTSENTCWWMRYADNKCGPDAKLYKPKLLKGYYAYSTNE